MSECIFDQAFLVSRKAGQDKFAPFVYRGLHNRCIFVFRQSEESPAGPAMMEGEKGQTSLLDKDGRTGEKEET